MTKNSKESEPEAAADWVAVRGEKWLTGLSGMEAMLAPIDAPLIRALKFDAPHKIADIGCGGGGTTLEILRRMPAGSVIHGFDLSPSLIEFARSRERSNDRGIAFEIADTARAAPPDELYSRLVSRFGIMFFDDSLTAFANLFRWLAPGGRFAFGVWGRLTENPWMASVQEVVAGLISLPHRDPEAPGPFRYAETDKLLSLLNSAGFGDLDVEDWRGALPIGGGLPASEAADFAIAYFSSFEELLAEAGDAALNEARQLLTERFSRHQKQGVVRMDANVHIFTGGCLR